MSEQDEQQPCTEVALSPGREKQAIVWPNRFGYDPNLWPPRD